MTSNRHTSAGDDDRQRDPGYISRKNQGRRAYEKYITFGQEDHRIELSNAECEAMHEQLENMGYK